MTFKEFLEARPDDPFAKFALAHPHVLKADWWFRVQWDCQDAGGRDVIDHGRDLWIEWSGCRCVTEITVDLKGGRAANIPPHALTQRLPDLHLIARDTWCWGSYSVDRRFAARLIMAAMIDYLGETPVNSKWVARFLATSVAFRRFKPKVELTIASRLVDDLFPGTKDPYAVYLALDDRNTRKLNRAEFESVRRK